MLKSLQLGVVPLAIILIGSPQFYCYAAENPLPARVEVSSKMPLLFHDGHLNLNPMEIQKSIAEGRGKIEAAHDRDIVLFLGRTGAGKSTNINYLFGCDMKKTRKGVERFAVPVDRNNRDLDVADPSQVPAKMARPGEAQSCTFFPQAYARVGHPLVLLDCQGFGEDRGKEAVICASILTEIAVRSARSVRICGVIPKGDLTMGGRNGFKSLMTILGKIINGVWREAPIGFLINKTDEDDDVRNIEESIESIKDGDAESFQELMSRKLGRPFDLKDKIPESLKDDSEVQERYETYCQLSALESIKSRMFIPKIFDKCDSSRHSFWSFLQTLPIVNKDEIFFRGFGARKEFDELVMKVADNSLKVMQARAGLRPYISIIKQLEDEAERAESLYASENFQTILEKTREKIAQSDTQIETTSAQVARLKTEFDTIAGKGKDLISDETISFHEEICRPWMWYRCYQLRRNSSPFDDYDVTLGSGTFKEWGFEDGARGIFKRNYESEANYDCKGTITLKVYAERRSWYQNKKSGKKDELDTAQRALETIKTQKKSHQKGLEDLLKKDSKKEVMIKKYRETKESLHRTLCIEKSIKKAYEEALPLVRLSYYILKNLDEIKDLDLKVRFINFYDKFEELMGRGEIDMPNSLLDPITFAPLLDPIETKCGHVFNNLSIRLHLENQQNCPECRTVVHVEDLHPVPHVERITAEFLSPMTSSMANVRSIPHN